MTQHTPGPWISGEALYSDPHAISEISDGEGQTIAIIHTPWGDRRDAVATDQAIANARLITAAPDLLLAAQQALALLRGYGCDDFVTVCIRAAIAKAIGEEVPRG